MHHSKTAIWFPRSDWLGFIYVEATLFPLKGKSIADWLGEGSDVVEILHLPVFERIRLCPPLILGTTCVGYLKGIRTIGKLPAQPEQRIPEGMIVRLRGWIIGIIVFICFVELL
jgi:hypothetical protein